VDRFAHAVIVAEALFGERSIDLIGEPHWIVAVILGTGHSCICAPRLVNVNFVINNKRDCDFLDDNCISGLRWSKIGDNSAQRAVPFRRLQDGGDSRGLI